MAIALGDQSSFGCKALAGAALTAGIGGGTAGEIRPVGGGFTGALESAGEAALNNAVTQGVNEALELQKGYNWAAVAASAGAAAARAVSRPPVLLERPAKRSALEERRLPAVLRVRRLMRPPMPSSRAGRSITRRSSAMRSAMPSVMAS